MGRGYSLKCRKCGYEFSANPGVGFMFPEVYQEMMKAGREGKLGKEVKRFLEEHPDGALDCDAVILQCTECGTLECAPDLTMYVPGENSPPPSSGNWSVSIPCKDAEYVAPWTLEKYTLFGLYDHRCEKCMGKMRIIKEKEFENLAYDAVSNGFPTKIHCPKCKERLFVGEIMMWD